MKRLILLAAAFAVLDAGAAYKCVDKKGITHFGDTPPAACADVLMLEVTPSGNVLRRIEPTPTPEQLRTQQEEDARKREADKIVAEQKRKDMALLSTYSSEREFDVARDRNIEPVRGRIKASEDRIKAIDSREKKIEDEMEFYKAKAKKGPDGPPITLVNEKEALGAEKKNLALTIARHETEINDLRTRFDTDKKRWVDMKSGALAKPNSDGKGPQTVTLSAGAAGRAKCGEKIYECPAGETYVCYEQDVYGRRKAYKVACVVERK
jgi:hypothetical protein